MLSPDQQNELFLLFMQLSTGLAKWFVLYRWREQAQSSFRSRHFKFKRRTLALVIPSAAHVTSTTRSPHLGTSRFLPAPVFFKTTILALAGKMTSLLFRISHAHNSQSQSHYSSPKPDEFCPESSHKNSQTKWCCSCSPGSRNTFLCSCRERNSPNFAF